MASTEPTEKQLREIAETDQESSFDMINLIKYRPLLSEDLPELY